MGRPQVQVGGGVTGTREGEKEELAGGGGGYGYA